ncbi:MAG: hypothetical protein MJY56_07805 [Bacteroidales bacterium]|nr:hypothetical protein [Bacteroidales bacterium]
MLGEVNAEMILEYMYPGMENRWDVRCKGTFYRNYCGDTMSYDTATGEVDLARDGFLKLLPDVLISEANELKGRDFVGKYKAVQRRKALLEDAFAPFDAFAFRQRLEVERNASELLETKIGYILKTFFSMDVASVTDPLVKEAAMLLPFVIRLRGDLPFVRDMISSLTGYEVTVDLSHRHSLTESYLAWMPKVIFTVRIPGLDPEKYIKETERLRPLAGFITEWLMPYDVVTELNVRAPGSTNVLSDEAMLDYNCKLH